MIILYGEGAGFGLPEAGPAPAKIEALLRMAALDYRKAAAPRSTGGGGRPPVLDDGPVRLADPALVRGHLERAYGIDFDEGLDARGRAQAWVLERLLEDRLGAVRRPVRADRAGGACRGPWRAFDPLDARALAALSVILGDKPYLTGQRPRAVDAVALGVLATLLAPEFDSELRVAVEKFTNLVTYVDRMMALLHPDFAWRPAESAPVAA